MEKYHEDAKDWLMNCSKKEIYEIYDLVGNGVPYESILEKYVKE